MYDTNDALPGQQDGEERFESDTQKLVHRHLKDKDHIITEDEVKSIRVGMTPTEEALENAALLEEIKSEKNKTSSSDTPLTPWDVAEPQNK